MSGRQELPATTSEDWARSDHYHNGFILNQDKALTEARANSAKNELPDIAVSAAQGKFLKLHARAIGAKRILEVGTLGGYSTIWLASALPEDGELITLEISPKHAEVARENIANAGLASKVKLIEGVAAESMAALSSDKKFDFIFVDADKPSNVIYFTHAKRLVKKGGIIIVDNVVRHARVADPNYTDENVEGVRALLKAVQNDKEVDATTLGMVGTKGYDGMMYIIRR